VKKITKALLTTASANVKMVIKSSSLLSVYCRHQQREISRVGDLMTGCVAWWRGGTALDLRLTGRGFKFQPVRFHATYVNSA